MSTFLADVQEKLLKVSVWTANEFKVFPIVLLRRDEGFTTDSLLFHSGTRFISSLGS